MRFSRFNGYGYNEMWGLDIFYFILKYKWVIFKVIDNCGGDKIFKLGIDGVIRKFYFRRKWCIVKFVCEFVFKWNYRICNVDYVLS